MVKRRPAVEGDPIGTKAKQRVRFSEAVSEGVEESKGGDNYDAETAGRIDEDQRPKIGDLDVYDEDEDAAVDRMTHDVEGEEEEGEDKFNDAGEVLEPFNLRNERQEGYFDTNGNYVWRLQDQEPDAWLAGLDDAAMEEAIGQAAEAQQRKDKEEEADALAADKDPLAQLDQSELAILASRLLESGETVLKGIQRLGLGGRGSRKGTVAGGKNQNNNESILKETHTKNKANFEKLTDLANHLMQKGLVDVYYTTKEDLHSLGNADSDISIQANQPNEMELNVHFEYQGKDGGTYGPYHIDQMRAWILGGYFSGDNVVLMRQVAPQLELHQPKELKIKSEDNMETSDDLLADLEDEENELEQKKVPDIERKVFYNWIPSDKIDFSQYVS